MGRNNWSGLFVKKRKKRRSRKKTKKGARVKKILSLAKRQKGGAFGGGMAAGMFAPLVMGTLGKILKINV